MSLLIKNMKMPTGCASCDFISFTSDGSAYCRRTMHLIRKMTERLEWCPILLELPEEHDRLVTEKSVRWAIDDIVLEISKRTGRVAMTKNETMEYINRLDTIIPAERSTK